MINLTAVRKISEDRYSFDTIEVNPEAIQYIETDYSAKTALQEGRFPAELKAETEFCKISVGLKEFTVVGTKEDITKKISTTKRLLKG